MKKNNCYCGKEKDFNYCCLPIIKGSRSATTAEDLMRARFSSFCSGNVDFIYSSHIEESRKDVDIDEVKAWSENANWRLLEVLNTHNGMESDETGVVEFIAHYDWEGVAQKHHEVAHFKKVEGEWFFVDGQMIRQTLVRSQPKVGRNEPCPCGSGKKFKKCCG